MISAGGPAEYSLQKRFMLASEDISSLDLYQAIGGYSGLEYSMALKRLFVACAFLVPLAVAEPASDTVNERLPVSAAELEAHWRVDCGATWAAVSASVGLPGAGRPCDISAEVRRVLELCVYIYQPPGDAMVPTCPDYRAALAAVDAADSPHGCAALRVFLSGATPPEPARCAAPAD